LNTQANPVEFYNEKVKPKKIKLNLEYVEKQNFAFDLSLLWRTFVGPFRKPPMPQV